MERSTRVDIIHHAIRWSNNMITEVANNHGVVLSENKRRLLLQIMKALGNYLQDNSDDDF